MALYAPCKRKSCEPCWIEYRERVASQTEEAWLTWRGDRRSCFASIILLDKQNSITPGWNALRQKLNRAGSEWVAIPQEGGAMGVLAWPPPPGSWPITDVGRMARQLLDTHERSRHVTSSRGINVAARATANWSLVGVTARNIEWVREIVESVGLTYYWNGIDCLVLLNVTDQQMDDLKMRLAA